MSIDKTTVRKVAKLARLKVAENDEEALAADMTKILGMVAALDAVNTDGVEPMTSVIDMKYPSRPDVVTDGGDSRPVTQNAPESEVGYFVVQKIVE